jgi:glutamate synthase (NADPH/NADH) large chain
LNTIAYNVRNTDRTIGARLSSKIIQNFGDRELRSDHLSIHLRGSAGQSLGAFLVRGLKLIVTGDANDFVGKGLSGGIIALKPYQSSKFPAHLNTIIGNTVLYGATSGQLFASGQAGERFAVRNSGADAVVEGCGSNGCEYMTGGHIVILGSVGDNFAAGMTGGMAFVFDADGSFEHRVNPESVIIQRLASGRWEEKLLAMIEMHITETGSRFGEVILDDWQQNRGKFWQVCPREMIHRLDWPLPYSQAFAQADRRGNLSTSASEIECQVYL